MELPSPLTASILAVLEAHTLSPETWHYLSPIPARCKCRGWVENDSSGTHSEHLAAQLTAAVLVGA